MLELARTSAPSGDPDYAIARPYLDKLAYLVIGSGTEGDLVDHARSSSA